MTEYVERHQLTEEEYERLQYLAASKYAVKEMLQTLHSQLSEVIYQEEVWWSEVAEKYQLDSASMEYTVDHNSYELLGSNKKVSEATQQRSATMQEILPGSMVGGIPAKPLVDYEEEYSPEYRISHDRQRIQNPPEEEFLNMEKLVKDYEAHKGL